MSHPIKPRKLSIIAGLSYLIIFFSAIFANFFVIENIHENALSFVENHSLLVRLGILAFLATVIFDVVVAWALQELYNTNTLSLLSTLFRLSHAILMGVAIFKLTEILDFTSSEDILNNVKAFNSIWLIGLLFFGVHLILLGNIVNAPKFFRLFLTVAGLFYMVDSTAFFLLANYEDYASILLALVATTSIIGEMSFTIWLLAKGGKEVAP